ncbi:MAG: hypothetical protein LBL84_01985 [Candidatus Nomurabacteria bacterium]|jgi:hypothetical protein|nr:hypothetical protein [Candidatus Nomurabacteria bacterium]
MKNTNHRRRFGLAALGLGLFAVVSLVGYLVAKSPNSAQAADANGWSAGNIISDSIFGNSGDMSEADIQNFLNQKIGSCDLLGQQTSEYGGGTRAQYAKAAWGYDPPFTCLNQYYEVPKTAPGGDMPANNYSNTSAIPAGAKSAAWIIKDAANRYGINPKVLLVKIATESVGPLTSDQWPLFSQYKYAMGSHCPDSGPGGAANCDPAYAGFSIQMYSAAELLRWYLDSMQEPWWSYKKPYQTNSILWNVAPRGCGAGDVYIESKATAALYTYTPYQPNQAALANMYGTGDNCSAYGNRNFWRTYVDWFGSSRATAAYQWTFISQEFYSDAAMTKQFSQGPLYVSPDQKIYVRIKAYNAGFSEWTQEKVKLGTSQPDDRSSLFYDQSWIREKRPASLKESSVKSDGIGTFEFILNAPTQIGYYEEHFNALAEGITWFNSIGLTLPIYVANGTTPSEQDYKNAIVTAGTELKTNGYRLSPDKNSALVLQEDGNLVYYTLYQPVWNSGTSGTGASRLVMQSDGDLVLYDSSNKALWHSNTSGNPGAYLKLQPDGNLVIYNKDSVAIWHIGRYSTNPNNTMRFSQTLPEGRRMYPGQSIKSPNGKYVATLQVDGNLVVYSNVTKKHALWHSYTWDTPVKYLVNQAHDGNLVLYDSSGKALWHSNTWTSKTPSVLKMQDDGNLVLYKNTSGATWHSHTYGLQ